MHNIPSGMKSNGKRKRQADGESQGFTRFDMSDEQDDGHFDEAGNFVWNTEDRAVQEEAWLDGVSEDQMGAALRAKQQQEYRDEQEDETMTEEIANRTLATLLRSRETVLQALQRLGAKKKPRQRSYGKRKKTEDQEMKQSEGQAPAQSAEDMAQFERVTEAADYLMRSGEVDVYSQIQEDFVPEEKLLAQRRALSAESERRVTFQETKEQDPPKPEVMWEYKGADGQVHGPFPTSSFVAWQAQGYFKGEGAVDMRRLEQPNATDDSREEEETKQQEPKLSAEQELLNDFEDSDDEEKTKHETDTQDRRWERSDQIDFSRY